MRDEGDKAQEKTMDNKRSPFFNNTIKSKGCQNTIYPSRAPTWPDQETKTPGGKSWRPSSFGGRGLQATSRGLAHHNRASRWLLYTSRAVSTRATSISCTGATHTTPGCTMTSSSANNCRLSIPELSESIRVKIKEESNQSKMSGLHQVADKPRTLATMWSTRIRDMMGVGRGEELLPMLSICF